MASFAEVDFSLHSSHVRLLPPVLSDPSDTAHLVYSRAYCLVHKDWLSRLILQNKRGICLEPAPKHPVLSDDEVQLLLNHPPASYRAPLAPTATGADWIIIELQYISLRPSALLRRFPPELLSETEALDFDFVSAEESFFGRLLAVQKKIQQTALMKKHPKSLQAILESHNAVETESAADVVSRLCGTILSCPFLDFSSRPSKEVQQQNHTNVLQPLFVASMMDHFVLALPYRPLTLLHCFRFTGNMVDSEAARWFLLYQCVRAMEIVQSAGCFVGNVGLDEFVIRDDLWVQLKPGRILDELQNLTVKSGVPGQSKSDDGDENDVCKVSEWTTLWCLGKISNYDYLLALNHVAGRVYGHPDYHPIMPWVVDFSSATEGWRDLTRSKYRLTKGDHQLDLTYQMLEHGMVPHHIPETFSDLTFYIYNARKIPKSVLCQHVRKRWVPAEYPSTMERLYKWTPDECIPEFYSDPSIFQSIHPDLPNLAPPPWCPDISSFLAYHRACLESDHVSSHLHHWIDLNFGYKLSGDQAVTSKNVVLSLQVQHKHVKGHGIVQLLTKPHPRKFRSADVLGRESVELKPLEKGRSRETSGSDLLAGSEEPLEDVVMMESVDGVSLASLTSFAGVETQVGILEELETLESLMDLSLAVDKEPAKLLEDFIPSPASLTSHADLLVDDLHVMACLAVELFSLGVDNTGKHWPVFRTAPQRLSYVRKLFASIEHCLSSRWASALRHILTSKVFPYTAAQVLEGFERVLPLPDWMADWHRFLTTSVVSEKPGLLADILEQMEENEQSFLYASVKQLLTSPDRYQWSVQLLDPLCKFVPHNSFCLTFVPLIHRLYAENPACAAPDHPVYLHLFQADFLQVAMARLGLRVFLRCWIVPLIEKLTDVPEVGPERLNEKTLVEESIFTIDAEDLQASVLFALTVRNDTSLQEPSWTKQVLDRTTNLHQVFSVLFRILFEVFVVGSFDDQCSGVATAQSLTLSVLVWLAEQIGPLLTSRHITSNLLKSLSLCYVEDEKLRPVSLDPADAHEVIDQPLVAGDVAAWGVTQALLDISALYGQCFIWNQYFSYCSELVKEALRKLTPMNEAGLIGCLEMIRQIVAQMADAVLLENLPFQIINEILYPTVELMTSFSHIFPVGVNSRRLLTVKWINLVYMLASRIGRDSAREMITDPLLVKFFGLYSQLYSPSSPPPQHQNGGIAVPERKHPVDRDYTDHEGSPFISITRDDASGELKVGTPITIDIHLTSPPATPQPSHHLLDSDEILQEIKAVFTESLAADAYVPFCKLLGQFHMDKKLINSDWLHEMCLGNLVTGLSSGRLTRNNSGSVVSRGSMRLSGDFLDGSEGSGQKRSIARSASVSGISAAGDLLYEEEVKRVDVKKDSFVHHGDRALRGNWLAYWQHELGLDRQDQWWNTKQIPLQTFSGHSGAVKSILAMESETCFLSGSKDKTVRLWSIRNSGDGSMISQSDGGIYVDHKKAVSDLRFLARERLVASCDGTVNLWDPWTLATVGRIETPLVATCIDVTSAPSSALFVGGLSEETCHVGRYDVRSKLTVGPAGQFKVSSTTVGLIRCLAVSSDNTWFACGFSSGDNIVNFNSGRAQEHFVSIDSTAAVVSPMAWQSVETWLALGNAYPGVISVFEQRTGMMQATWKPYESDVIQLICPDHASSLLISIGSDNVVSLWDLKREPEERLIHSVRAFPEPILHAALAPRGNGGGDLVALLGGNRIGVLGDVLKGGSSTVMTKVRPDVFKGNCLSMAVLPMNRQLLVGGENGSSLLLC